jgi:anaphase-promoting complex subunit 6
VLDSDPYHYSCLPVHIACQVEIQDTNGLFYLAHKLVDSHHEKAVAWFAVGCYYYLIGNNESARRYFGRSSRIDLHFGPAWVGFGHSFAAEGEHDQAMAAYSTATRLMSGCHVPLLYIGMEYMATSNLGMANQYLTQANAMSSGDPAVAHELGVSAYFLRKYVQAEEYFRIALENPQADTTFFVATATALAMVYHKQRRYEDAESSYLEALAAAPQSQKIYAGLGFTYHCAGKRADAIELYHRALSLQSEDPFCSHMLEIALEEEMRSGVQEMQSGSKSQ